MSSDRVMRWRLLLEEYGVEWRYIKGETNVLADMLSRHPVMDTKHKNDIGAESYALSKEERDEYFPVDLLEIATAQQRESKTSSKFKKLYKAKSKYFSNIDVRGTNLITMYEKIYIPYNIRGRIVNWYHYNLCHPGSSRLQLTLAQTMYWPGMVSDCVNYTKSCDKCQRFKKKRVKYGKLPPKVAEVVPWETLCIDLVGPYTVTLKNNKETTLSAMTFIDPATGWFEIAELGNKSSAHVSHLLDSMWLCRYPHP